MAGLLLLTVMAGYITLTVWLFVKVEPLWGKSLVLIAAFLIPTADAMYYRRQLDAYCKTEAGYKVYAHASKGAVIVDNAITRSDYMKSYPLDIVEAKDEVSITNEGVLYELYRFERQADGSIKGINIKTLTAPYELIRKEKDTGSFLKLDIFIVDRQTGEKLGLFSNLYYYGGWYRRNLLGSLADSGKTLVADCGYEGQTAPEIALINRVFLEN